MGNFILRILINAAGLWAAAWLLPGINVTSQTAAGVESGSSAWTTILAYLFIGLIMGVVNAWVKPIVRVLSFPVTFITLGLFTVVINAAMLWLAAWLSTFTPIHFTIDTFFWTAIFAALIVSAVSMVAGGLVKSGAQN